MKRRPVRRHARSNERQDTTPAGGWDWDIPADRFVYIATLLNPADHRPYVVAWDPPDKEVVVVTPTVGDINEGWGQGYFSTSDDPAGRTNCARSHTPSGVAKKGLGLGLMLYSGMALTAAYATTLSKDKALKLNFPRDLLDMGPCISSSEDQRSGAADKWWKHQVREGLAEEEGGGEECDEREGSVEIDADDAGIDADYIESHVESESGRIGSVSGYLSGTVSYEFCSDTTAAQVLRAKGVFEAGLVLDYNPKLEKFAEKADVVPSDVFSEIYLDRIEQQPIWEWFVQELRRRQPTQEEMRAFLARNRLAEQEALPGVELGETSRVLAPRMKRNASQHSAAWKRQFGALIREA